METAPTRMLSHYRILGKLGSGGMGEVHLAEDTALGRKVALKLLTPELAHEESAGRRLIKEAQAAAHLDHPNICSIYEAGEADGICFIAMQLIDGQSLSERLAGTALPADEILDIASQVADALGEAHRHGIVHRDVKPQNVMIDARGQAKVMDFGLAKTFGTSPDVPSVVATESALTKPGTIVGTIAYMSPEQVRGQDVDARSDVWSFGVMLHEMVTGRHPFGGVSGADLISAILRDRPTPRPSDIGGGFGPIIDRCLKKNPTDRFPDAGQVHSALEIVRSVGESKRARRERRSSGTRAARTVRKGKIRSLAVLPLENHSVDPGQEYFAEAMTESLLTDLAQISGLRVVSRTSVVRYKNARKPLPDIARELNVDAIIEGSVLRANGRVRVTAQLIHGPTDRHLWAKSYERDADDILALQSEVARAIADEVRVKLTPREVSRLSVVRRINRDAHEAYLKGIYHFDRGDLGRGLEYFQESTRIDSTYAPAWGQLARGYHYLGFFGVMAPVDAFSNVKEAAWKAQDLDPELAEAYGWRAMASLYYDWNWAAAGEELRRAIELKPSHAEISHYYGHYLMVMGHTKKGLQACEHAMALDPLGTIITACLGWHCLFSRQVDDAIPPARRALAMDPDLFWAHTILGWAYEQKSMADEAIAEYEKALSLSGGMALNLATLGHALARFGRTQEATAVLGDLLERRKRSYVSAYDVATVFVGLGDQNSAFEWLEEACKERSSFLIHINWDPRLDEIRPDPRFGNVLGRIGLPPASAVA